MRNPSPVSALKSVFTALVAAVVARRLVAYGRSILAALTATLVLPGLAYAADTENKHQLDIPIGGVVALAIILAYVFYIWLLVGDAKSENPHKHSRPVAIAGFVIAALAIVFLIRVLSNTGLSFYVW